MQLYYYLLGRLENNDEKAEKDKKDQQHCYKTSTLTYRRNLI